MTDKPPTKPSAPIKAPEKFYTIVFRDGKTRRIPASRVPEIIRRGIASFRPKVVGSKTREESDTSSKRKADLRAARAKTDARQHDRNLAR